MGTTDNGAELPRRRTTRDALERVDSAIEHAEPGHVITLAAEAVEYAAEAIYTAEETNRLTAAIVRGLDEDAEYRGYLRGVGEGREMGRAELAAELGIALPAQRDGCLRAV